MEHLEELKNWIMRFPKWGDGPLDIDITGAQPDHSGLFPMGTRVLEYRESVTGNTFTRLQQNFLLRRIAPRGLKGAVWMLEFHDWVHQNVRSAPKFGKYQRMWARDGKMLTVANTGLGIYEVKLTFEYVIEE